MEALDHNTRLHLALAEDDRELCDLLELVLIRAGYRVTICENGQELRELLDGAEEIAMVISDLHMPVLSGLEVLASQNNKPTCPPFLCMTAFGDDKTHQDAYQLGAAAVIDKPFDLDRMLALVHDISLHKGKNNLSSRSQL